MVTSAILVSDDIEENLSSFKYCTFCANWHFSNEYFVMKKCYHTFAFHTCLSHYKELSTEALNKFLSQRHQTFDFPNLLNEIGFAIFDFDFWHF